MDQNYSTFLFRMSSRFAGAVEWEFRHRIPTGETRVETIEEALRWVASGMTTTNLPPHCNRINVFEPRGEGLMRRFVYVGCVKLREVTSLELCPNYPEGGVIP